jgi:hypothetical protein
MVGEVDDETGEVVIGKMAVAEPAAIVTLAGTVATVLLLLVRVIEIGTAAMPVRVTVPVDVLPPTTLVGLSEREEREGVLTVSVAVRAVPFIAAEMVDEVLAATGLLATENVAVVRPAVTVTFEGT